MQQPAVASEIGIPRRVFALSSGEAKPIYVDFNSRALVSILARQIRAAGQASVRFSEILSDPEHLWLTDAQGNHYPFRGGREQGFPGVNNLALAAMALAAGQMRYRSSSRLQ